MDGQNFSEDLLEGVRQRYIVWSEFMEKQVEFWKVEGSWHTKPHCARVLLLALLLGKQHHLSDSEMDALAAAAVFHDSRRQDDWLDVGHGQRAADYYKAYCTDHHMVYDERTFYIMAYHDQNDDLGLRVLQEKFTDNGLSVLLYRIFKDADALDRFRLGPDALDTKYLRTEQAKGMVDFSKALLQSGPEKLLNREGE